MIIEIKREEKEEREIGISVKDESENMYIVALPTQLASFKIQFVNL